MKTLFLLFGFILSTSLHISVAQAQQSPNSDPAKAVLIVGPQEDGTKDAITKMNRIYTFLKANGVEVERFYDGNSDWEKIKKAADGASILVYSGHGNESCGFSLSETVSNEEIIKNLKLKKNALVLFQSVCYGAGSSAGDDIDIGLKEAEKRVTNYAKAFIEKGIGCYFAVNTDDGALAFLKSFYAGKTVQQCFEDAAEIFYKVEKLEKASLGENMKIGIASSNWGGTATRTTYTNGVKKVEKVASVKDYSIAFIADPEFSLKKLLVK